MGGVSALCVDDLGYERWGEFRKMGKTVQNSDLMESSTFGNLLP